jgi:hypothetical protein
MAGAFRIAIRCALRVAVPRTLNLQVAQQLELNPGQLGREMSEA